MRGKTGRMIMKAYLEGADEEICQLFYSLIF